MSLPIDEMLLELQSALEGFEADPTYENLDIVFAETRRIDITCENEVSEI